MDKSLPKVLVLGLSPFVGEKLVKDLLASSLAVVGVGEYIKGLEEEDNFLYLSSESEINMEFDYGFDFSGRRNDWERWLLDGGKLTMVLLNQAMGSDRVKEWYKGSPINWRIVEVYGVFGPGMGEMGFLTEAFERAVDNESLVLPKRGVNFRLLADVDAVEAVKRACFLSGTKEEVFLVVGKETNSEEVAEALINEAKMTKVSVLERAIEVDEWESEVVEDNWKKLRWEPEVKFGDGIKETLQYFFTRKDEMSRKEKKENVGTADLLSVQREEKKKTEPVKKGYETVVEGEVEKEEVKIENERVLKPQPLRGRQVQNDKSYVLPTAKRVKKKGVLKQVQHDMLVEKKAEIVIPKLNKENVNSIKIEPEAVRPKREIKMSIKVPKVKIKLPKVKIKLPKVFGRGNPARTLIVGLILGLIILILWWPVEWIMFAVNLKKEAEAVGELVVEGKYDEASEKAGSLSTRSKRYISQIDNWGLNRIEPVRNFESVLRVADDVYEMAEKGVELAKIGEKISQEIFEGKGEIDWEKSFDKLSMGLVELEMDVGRVGARLRGDWSFLPTNFSSLPNRLTEEVGEMREKLGLVRRSMEFLPDFLGTDGKRRDYMVLLQNESELRAGGGFIGSYAILSFEDGVLLNFEVKDIYEADGQLKGHVEPPEPISKYLGEAGWYMRDSNWKVDFTEASKEIRWFLEKETGRSVDGVIGINMALARAMLSVTGELYVPDFEEKINENNLYEQAQFYAETKFFPGSNQKTSFLGGVSRQLFEEVKNLPNDKKFKLVEKIIDLLEQNEIQLALVNKESALRLDELGWSGRVYSGSCAGERCLADYVYIVESNVGVNKANYFLYRNIEELVDISENLVSRVMKINYENTAKNNNWPGGDYKNYMRVYLPSDVVLGSIAVSDPTDPTKTKIYSSGEDLTITDVMGKKELGFLVTVPVMSKRTVEIRYSSPISLGQGENFSYLNYIQKQPGMGDTGLVVLVSFPEGWLPMQVEPAASLVSGKLLFNMKLNKDIRMGVEIGK